jgi:hypothetical protein
MFVASIAVGALLTLLLIVQVSIILARRSQAASTRVELNRINGQLAKINAEQSNLNTIIERKAVSWTRIFADLEKVMPPDVRLVSVRLPQVDSQNQVLLDMVVGAKDFKPVLDLLKKLEASPQFGPTTVVNSLPPSQTDPLLKYRMSVSYAQKL